MGHVARVLFEFGAIHSFVSTIFAFQLNKNPESLKYQLIESASIGVDEISTRYIKGVKL